MTMTYRTFQQRSTGQWLDVLMTVAEGNFSVPAEAHRDQIATGWGLAPLDIEVVDSPFDVRTGTLIRGPVIAPPPDPAIAIDAAAADVVAEIDKAFTARTTALTDAEKAGMKGKVIALIARAQGR